MKRVLVVLGCLLVVAATVIGGLTIHHLQGEVNRAKSNDATNARALLAINKAVVDLQIQVGSIQTQVGEAQGRGPGSLRGISGRLSQLQQDVSDLCLALQRPGPTGGQAPLQGFPCPVLY
jgi:hypothetical protein